MTNPDMTERSQLSGERYLAGLFKALLVAALLLALPTTLLAADNPWHGSLSGKLRAVYFDRDYETASKSYQQGALGLELNYSSDSLWDVLGVDLSLYQVQELDTQGARTSDVLGVDNGGRYESSISKLGQAALRLDLGDYLKVKYGRQTLKTLMLTTATSRAIPNTFSGIRLDSTLAGIDLYGVQIDKWSPRHDDQFEEFRTDLSDKGDIDYIRILGASYTRGPLSLQLEQLVSRDYLKKTGLVVGYKQPLQDGLMTITGGFYTSKDDGKLFIPGAESGEVDSGTIDNDARVYYLDLNWRRDALTLGAALTRIRDDVWIEDNYAGDHGTTPIPTRATIGPDLTGKNEDLWQVRLGYDWSALLPGLSTTLTHTRGENAENTYDKSLGIADEWYTELDLKWAIPGIKGLSFRWIAHDYHSDERGKVAVVKEDDFDNRLYLDYVFNF